ncbi:sensor domain-containing diguanylate cyclase [Falsibacillus pallidus]|uniref:sensor domain-containing diguanylate cyclase n=1 Tax=Falsibacillus pallidus TaxID=493781 RepID=UPI003D98B891
MSIKRSVSMFFWISWAAIVPAGLYLTYLYYPPAEIKPLDMALFLLLAAIITFFPITINGITIFMIQWVTLAALLSFNLFFSILILQLAIILLMFRVGVGKVDIYRLPLNSLMFFLASTISGMIFFAVGGHVGDPDIHHVLLPAAIHEICYYILNHLLLYVSRNMIGLKYKFFGADLTWETLAIMMVYPFSIALFFLYKELGVVAIFLLGVPFVSVSLVLRMYNSTEKINDYIQKAVEIGHELTQRLKVDEVLDLFIQKISQNLPVDYAYILSVEGDKLDLLRRVEMGEQKDNDLIPLKKNQGISGVVWAEGKSVLFNDKSEWSGIANGYMPPNVESVLSVPILRNQETVGVLLLASTRKKAYEKYQLMIVDMLCSYFAVAIENGRHYEETKRNSERCALTNLYNYRYFENLLTNEYEEFNKGNRKEISLIMLDIDHFKVVNDTYGHQSGNEILVEMADRLSKLIGNYGTLARYGGEEFVILLPNVSKEEATSLAETVRLTIANRPFTLHNNLADERKCLMVRITASIGVATAPKDADDALSLIRHADRALYIGAKRAGRNRVAEYVK